MKRGSSGLNLVVAVDKPEGMTSHDVVSACRRIFNEKRIGHAGTLDPFATGVLPLLIGSAAKLSNYLTGHDKAYSARISFGIATDTDDSEGTAIREQAVPPEVLDEGFARSVLQRFIGIQKQMPPVYSALKRDGRKACDEARRGHVIELEPRTIDVKSAALTNMGCDETGVFWDVTFHVSKGTYIRALARDIGRACGTVAHLLSLRRIASGRITLRDCVGLATLEEVSTRAALDPVRVLGLRICFIDDTNLKTVCNGGRLSAARQTFHSYIQPEQDACACTSGLVSVAMPEEDDLVCMVRGDLLLALYRMHAGTLKPEVVFKDGVRRGQSF